MRDPRIKSRRIPSTEPVSVSRKAEEKLTEKTWKVLESRVSLGLAFPWFYSHATASKRREIWAPRDVCACESASVSFYIVPVKKCTCRKRFIFLEKDARVFFFSPPKLRIERYAEVIWRKIKREAFRSTWEKFHGPDLVDGSFTITRVAQQRVPCRWESLGRREHVFRRSIWPEPEGVASLMDH